MLITFLIVAGWVVAIAGAALITAADPLAQELTSRLQPPSWTHPFGTDQLGRDVLARVLYGGRTSLPAAAAVVLIGFILGASVGAVAGFAGGYVDECLMRVTDMVLAFPVIVLAMAVAAALGGGLFHGIIALAAIWWAHYARVSRGLVLELKSKDFVIASRAAGRRPLRILLAVIMPNALPALFIMASIDLGRAILNFAMLSFLGLGARPPAPEWGLMVASGVQVFHEWWVSTFPALAIFSLVLAFNMAGDALRDVLDPWIAARR